MQHTAVERFIVIIIIIVVNNRNSGFLMKTAQLGVKIKPEQTNRPVNELHLIRKFSSQPLKRWPNE